MKAGMVQNVATELYGIMNIYIPLKVLFLPCESSELLTMLILSREAHIYHAALDE